MKKLILSGLFLIVILGLILSFLYPRDSIQLEFNSAESSTTPSEIIENRQEINSQISPSIQINSQQLYRYLEKIIGERYSDLDRAYIRDYLVNQLQEFGYSPQLLSFETGVNIWAEKPGINPDAGSILIAAHYDTVQNSPGADDNGTGLAVILETARLLSKIETFLNLEIAFFDQEETGLQGSFAFLTQTENIERLKSVIILDMVGYACHTPGCQTYPAGLTVDTFLKAAGVKSPDQGEFLAVVGETQNLQLLEVFHKWNRNITDKPPLVTVLVPFKGVLTPGVLRSDHAAFWYQGIPAVLVTDTADLRSPYYHQPTDTIDNLDQSFFVGSAQILFNILQDLLNPNS